MVTPQQVLAILQGVYDPDYRDRSIVDMGLVTEADVSVMPEQIRVQYGLTAPMCPFSAAIGLMIKFAVEKKLALPVAVSLRPGHRQGELVSEILEDPAKARELMAKLQEFGILERCIKL